MTRIKLGLMQTSSCSSLLVLCLVGLAAGCEEPAAFTAQRISAVDSGQDTGSGCGGISNVGCCQGKVLFYCSNSQLQTKQCPLKCGWSSAYGLYHCGSSAAGDPTSKHPRVCPAADGAVHHDHSVKTDLVATDLAPPDAGNCGGLGFAGCCHKETLYFCSGGKVLWLSCSKSLHCGWNTASGFYDCGTPGKGDPGGKYPKACSSFSWDGGLLADAAADLKAADLTMDTAPETSPDMGAPQLDPSAQPDAAPAKKDAPGPGDGPGPEIVGLDVSGLEGGSPDVQPTELQGGGCDCNFVLHPGHSPATAWWFLLALGMFLAARRRKRRL